MKLDQINSSALQSLLKAPGQTRSNNTNKVSGNSNDAVSLSQYAKLGTKVVQYSLSQSLTINGKAYTAATQEENTDDSSDSLFDFQKVADNVLSFVTRTINARKDAGDSTDKLKEMLGQAYKGIDQGFSDARAELDKSGVLSDDLKEGIDKSYDLIQKGMSDYEDDLFGDKDTTATDESVETSATAETPATIEKSDVKSAKELGNALLAAMTGRQSADVELVTKEGDKVTISFDDKQQWRLQQNYGLAKKALQAYGDTGASDKKTTQASGSAFYSHTSQFSFKVEGDLSATELQSISDMVNKIGSLSDSFFNGNVGDALQQAQQLDLSDSELASMSLSLYQKQMFGVHGSASNVSGTDMTSGDNTAQTSDEQTSGSTLPDNLQTAADLPDYFNQLGDYMQQLQSLFNQMIAAFNPDMQTQMQGWVAAKQHPEQSDESLGSFVSFNQRMQQALSMLSDGQSSAATGDSIA